MKRYIYKLVKKINTSIITRKEMEAQAESLNRKSNQIRFIYSLEKFQALQQETFTEKLPKCQFSHFFKKHLTLFKHWKE